MPVEQWGKRWRPFNLPKQSKSAPWSGEGGNPSLHLHAFCLPALRPRRTAAGLWAVAHVRRQHGLIPLPQSQDGFPTFPVPRTLALLGPSALTSSPPHTAVSLCPAVGVNLGCHPRFCRGCQVPGGSCPHARSVEGTARKPHEACDQSGGLSLDFASWARRPRMVTWL